MKSSGYKPYMANIVQELHPNDYAARVAFAESTLEKIKNSPEFVKILIFSDEAIFHLDGGINKHNHRHWSKNNPNWLIEKALQSPKVMVWAAMELSVHFFFGGNVTGDSYLDMLQNEFFSKVFRA